MFGRASIILVVASLHCSIVRPHRSVVVITKGPLHQRQLNLSGTQLQIKVALNSERVAPWPFTHTHSLNGHLN